MASCKPVTSEVSQEEDAIVEAQEDAMGDESSMQEFILRFNDKDITVSVDSATAYLLTNDHNYAEQYAEAVMNDEVPVEPPEIEYLIEDDAQSNSVNRDLVPMVTLTADKQERIGKNTNSSWTFGHMELLLNIRLSLESKFRHPSARKFQLWNEVAKKINLMFSINTTGTICHTKWRNMINTYKRVLKNVKVTGKTPNWPLYDVLFQAYGDLSLNEIDELQKVPSGKIAKDKDKLWRTSDVKLLISSRLKMQELFMQPGIDTMELWTAISKNIDCVSSLPQPEVACKTKWISLLGTYKKKLDCHETDEDPYTWQYFKMFHDAYKGFTVDKKGEDIQEERAGKWTHSVAKLLIQTRIDMDAEFRSEKRPKARLWSIAADKVNKVYHLNFTGAECDSKWRSLLKTYRKRSYRMYETGENTTGTSWPHYNLMDQLFRSTGQPSRSNTDGLLGDTKVSDEEDESLDDTQSTELWPSSDIELLISSRLEMQATFSVTDCDRDELWTSISQKINCVSSLPHPGIACKMKWLQLLSTYKSKLDYNESGEDPYVWPYFKMFHEAYKGFIVNHNGDNIQEDQTAVWTHGITKLLVLTRIDMDKNFQSQNIKKTTLWSRVAARMNSVLPLKLTGADCDCKWRNLMGTYRKICSRINETGENTSSWPYYDLIDKLYSDKNIGLTSNIEAFLEVNINEENNAIEEGSYKYWTRAAIDVLIKTRIELEEKFQNPKCKRLVLWNEVSKKVNKAIVSGTVSGTDCNVKWRNLKRTYRVLMSKMNDSHVAKSNWPYFKVFQDLYGDFTNGKSPVEVEVSFNEDHGYVFEVLPTNATDKSKPEIAQNLNSGTFQQKPVPETICSESQLPTTNRGIKRFRSDPVEEAAGPSKMCASIKEERWLKLMLLDWKKERRERWEEKKQIEREKIKAVNNLTKAILSLERKESE